MENTYNGMRIVSERDKNHLIFDGFEGVVINSTDSSFCSIEISRMVKRDGGYFVDSFTSIPSTETIKHSVTSGKAKADFLYSKAKEFAHENEEIAICESLMPNLRLLDSCWKREQELLKKRQIDTSE